MSGSAEGLDGVLLDPFSLLRLEPRLCLEREELRRTLGRLETDSALALRPAPAPVAAIYNDGM